MIPVPHIRRLGQSVAAVAAAAALSGCVFDSPYWAQTFATTTTSIPIQTWTTDKTRSVKIECSKSYHGGLYPFGGPEVWTLVTNITPSTNASYDPSSGVIYSAGKTMVLPAACWNADYAYSPPLYMTSLRATQLTSTGSTQTYYVFDSTGLECLGRENGKAKSWFGWLSANCSMTYSGSTTQLPYVRIIANALGSGAAAASTSVAEAPSARVYEAPSARVYEAPSARVYEAPSALKSRRSDEATPAELSLRLAAEAPDAAWAPTMEARLRGAFDNAMPEGTQLMETSCRATMCRAEVQHRDAQAQTRFVAALAPLGLFSNDGQRGVMQLSDEGSGLRSTYFIAREGHTLASNRTR